MVSPVCYSDPGMTNANMQFVEVDVDADSHANANVDPQLEVRPLGFWQVLVKFLKLGFTHKYGLVDAGAWPYTWICR